MQKISSFVWNVLRLRMVRAVLRRFLWFHVSYLRGLKVEVLKIDEFYVIKKSFVMDLSVCGEHNSVYNIISSFLQ